MNDLKRTKKRSFRQNRAASLLVAGFKITQIAKLLEVRRETIWAWKKQDRFMKRVERLQAEFIDEVHRLTMPLMERALNRLGKMLDSPDLKQVKFAIIKIFQLNGKLPWGPERRRRA